MYINKLYVVYMYKYVHVNKHKIERKPSTADKMTVEMILFGNADLPKRFLV